MDELNHFMRANNFQQDHRIRMRDFFRQTQESSMEASYDKLILKMSAQLRGDTALIIGTTTLQRIWYFSLGQQHSFRNIECEPQFLSLVALNLTTTVYEAREVIPTYDLTVIVRGVVARRLVMLTKGAVLGTDCVIPETLEALRPLEAAYSLTFVQTSMISRASLVKLVEHFPNSKAALNHAAAIYTLKGAFRLAWTQHKRLLREKGMLGARVSSQEVHSGALQYTKGAAVLAAYGGGNRGMSCAGGGGMVADVGETFTQLTAAARLAKLKHFRRKSEWRATERKSFSTVVTEAVQASAGARGGGGGTPATAVAVADPGPVPTLSSSSQAIDSDDEDFGEGYEIHKDVRRLKRLHSTHTAHLNQKIENLRDEMRLSINGMGNKLEGVMGAIETLDKGIARIGLNMNAAVAAAVTAAAQAAVSNKQQQPTSPPVQHKPPAAAAPATPPPPVQPPREAYMREQGSVWDDPAPLSDAKKAADEGGRTKTRVRRHKSSAGSSWPSPGSRHSRTSPTVGVDSHATASPEGNQAQPQQQATATVMEALNAVSALLGGCDISSPATSASPSPAAQQRSRTRGRDDSMDA